MDAGVAAGVSVPTNSAIRAFASARAIVSSWVGRTHRELEQLADHLERELLARRR